MQLQGGQAFEGVFEAEIIGVVGAVRPGGFDSPPRPEEFIPPRAGAERRSNLRRANVGGPRSIPAIQNVVWGAAPSVAF